MAQRPRFQALAAALPKRLCANTRKRNETRSAVRERGGSTFRVQEEHKQLATTRVHTSLRANSMIFPVIWAPSLWNRSSKLLHQREFWWGIFTNDVDFDRASPPNQVFVQHFAKEMLGECGVERVLLNQTLILSKYYFPIFCGSTAYDGFEDDKISIATTVKILQNGLLRPLRSCFAEVLVLKSMLEQDTQRFVNLPRGALRSVGSIKGARAEVGSKGAWPCCFGCIGHRGEFCSENSLQWEPCLAGGYKESVRSASSFASELCFDALKASSVYMMSRLTLLHGMKGGFSHSDSSSEAV